MPATTISSREFSHNLAKGRRATSQGPVFITDRGKPTFALLKIEEYYKMAGDRPRGLLDVTDSLPGGDFDFEPPRLTSMGLQPANSE